MLDRQTAPLEIASRILEPETIREIRQNRQAIDRTGYQILDRWALNQPEELKALEMRDADLVMLRLYEQQELEGDARERRQKSCPCDHDRHELHSLLH